MLFFKGIHWIAGLLVCVLLAGKCCSKNDTGVKCPKPKIENGKVIGLKEVYKPEEESKFECNDGYFLRGYQRIMCQDDGIWSNNPPFCQKISCPYLDNPRNGAVNVKDISLPGDSANYTCNEKYKLDGEPIVNCSTSGKWEPNEVPSCCQEKDTSCDYHHLGWIIPVCILFGVLLCKVPWKKYYKVLLGKAGDDRGVHLVKQGSGGNAGDDRGVLLDEQGGGGNAGDDRGMRLVEEGRGVPLGNAGVDRGMRLDRQGRRGRRRRKAYSARWQHTSQL